MEQKWQRWEEHSARAKEEEEERKLKAERERQKRMEKREKIFRILQRQDEGTPGRHNTTALRPANTLSVYLVVGTNDENILHNCT